MHGLTASVCVCIYIYIAIEWASELVSQLSHSIEMSIDVHRKHFDCHSRFVYDMYIVRELRIKV